MADNSLIPKVLVEANIPYIDRLSSVAQVVRLAPADFTPDSVREADAIVVRTRTRCNQALLNGSRVKFVGTATIGTDHIDLDWCRATGITVANAPGCNARAVAEYVFGSIAHLRPAPLNQYTIAIVGVGHVGRIVEQWANSLDMTVLPVDPPCQRAEGGSRWYSLVQAAAQADIITFHTPLTREGQDATFHLADNDFFAQLQRKPLIINAARGPIVDTAAWLNAIDRGLCSDAVVDCWEGEPNINAELLAKAAVASPHIAGYSRLGKMRASQMVVDALTQHFNLPRVALFDSPLPDTPHAITYQQALAAYNPADDTNALRANPQAFEDLRNHYKLR